MTEKLFRSVALDRANIKDDTITISFVSEEPYLRSFGYEVLDLSRSDFSFINSGNAPFLLDHRNDDHTYHIGVVERAWIEDGQGKAQIRFSTDPSKQGVIEDIKNGVRTNISVGYSVTEQTKMERSIDGKPVYSFAFSPYECSSVSVPADPTVGTNRADETVVIQEVINTPNEQQTLNKGKEIMEDLNTQSTVDVEAIRSAAVKQATQRAVEIQTLCSKFNIAERAIEFINSDKTLVDVKEEVLSAVEKRSADAQVTAQPTTLFNIGSSEKRTFDNGKAFKAAFNRDWKDAGFEREQCQERAHQSGGLIRYADNIVLLDPNANVRAGVTATTAGSGAELVGTNYHPEKLVDALWNKTWLDKIGTDTMLGLVGNASFPVISSNATTSWGKETLPGGLTAQGLTTALKSISPKEMVAKFEMTRQSLVQDVPNVQAKILDQLYQAIAQALDNAAINGVTADANTLALSTTGLINEITGGNLGVQGTNGLAPTLAAFTALRKKAIANKINVDEMKWLLSSSLFETLATTLKDSANTNSGYIINEGQSTLRGLPVYASQNVPSAVAKGTSTVVANGGVSTAILGKWDDFLVAQWGSIAVEFDYATGADNSKVFIRAFSFWDMIIKRTNSFYMVPDFIG